ncbi:MAG: hypothetical protein CMD30_02055 [Flavobacteriales bacterium]|nr:hypothetical protein [Flavobacteriales bacterium]|tara:strand:- start:328 stop:945 length:618 start_codon:yes stop_codon:yes gene_type:complete
MKIYIQRKANYNNVEIVSEKLELNEEILSFWLLNRVEVPHFNNPEELKNFITAINLLIEPVSGGVYGPVSYFYDNDLSPIESLGNMVITTSSGEAIEVEINKYKMWDDNQPEGNVKLRDILQEEKDEVLSLKSYSSYSADKEEPNSRFTFSSLYVDYLVPFLSIYYNEKNGKNALDWYDLSTGDKVEVIDDIDDHWIFATKNEHE